jgi:hypothetical protein
MAGSDLINGRNILEGRELRELVEVLYDIEIRVVLLTAVDTNVRPFKFDSLHVVAAKEVSRISV